MSVSEIIFAALAAVSGTLGTAGTIACLDDGNTPRAKEGHLLPEIRAQWSIEKCRYFIPAFCELNRLSRERKRRISEAKCIFAGAFSTWQVSLIFAAPEGGRVAGC